MLFYLINLLTFREGENMKKIQFPSGSYFVEKKNVTSTLFESGGTASGYFHKLPKRGIRFYNMQDEPILFLVNNKHGERFFVSCYMFGKDMYYMNAVSTTTEKMLGLDSISYSEGIDLANDIFESV